LPIEIDGSRRHVEVRPLDERLEPVGRPQMEGAVVIGA
jgi:hypothetical protein